MTTYYVAHVRIHEAEGTCTERVVCVYRVESWDAARAIEAARKAGATPTHTVEYLHASRDMPTGYSGAVI